MLTDDIMPRGYPYNINHPPHYRGVMYDVPGDRGLWWVMLGWAHLEIKTPAGPPPACNDNYSLSTLSTFRYDNQTLIFPHSSKVRLPPCSVASRSASMTSVLGGSRSPAGTLNVTFHWGTGLPFSITWPESANHVPPYRAVPSLLGSAAGQLVPALACRFGLRACVLALGQTGRLGRVQDRKRHFKGALNSRKFVFGNLHHLVSTPNRPDPDWWGVVPLTGFLGEGSRLTGGPYA